MPKTLCKKHFNWRYATIDQCKKITGPTMLERCTKSLASAQLGYGLAPEGASAADLVQSMQEKTGPASQKGRVA
jgi:hypothetical protein